MGRTAHLTAYRSTYLGEGQSLKFHDPVYDTRGVLAIRIFFCRGKWKKKWWDSTTIWSDVENLVSRPKIQSSLEQTGLCSAYLISCRVQVYGPNGINLVE